jgi:hypothetical protein
MYPRSGRQTRRWSLAARAESGLAERPQWVTQRRKTEKGGHPSARRQCSPLLKVARLLLRKPGVITESRRRSFSPGSMRIEPMDLPVCALRARAFDAPVAAVANSDANGAREPPAKFRRSGTHPRLRQRISATYDLSAICRLQLLHDPSDMGFNGALAHLQLIRYDFVGFAKL